jgi:hypothetical protein
MVEVNILPAAITSDPVAVSLTETPTPFDPVITSVPVDDSETDAT